MILEVAVCATVLLSESELAAEETMTLVSQSPLIYIDAFGNNPVFCTGSLLNLLTRIVPCLFYRLDDDFLGDHATQI
jgi:hypothetical protein